MATSPQEDQNEVQDIAADFHVPRVPYNEYTIVNIIRGFYREGHAIDQVLCDELHIDPVVISLMKRLPFFRFWGIAADIEFYPYSRAFVYLDDYEIRGGRDPDRFSYEEPRPECLPPQEIALTCSINEGIHVIMDPKENTIRVWSFDEPPPGDEMEDYLKYYPYHAPMYLASYLQQVRSLEIIPSVSRYDRKLYNKHYPEVPKIKKVIQEQCGWPYDFQEAERKANSKVTWKRIDLK